MATIKEIAKACDVSIATVSNVLNRKDGVGEETRKLVLEKVKELNYTPNTAARDLKMKKSQSIGVVVEDMTIFCTPDIVDGITEYCEKEKYHILLSNLRLYQKYREGYYYRDDYYNKVQEAVWELQAKQAAGIIYVAAHERTIRCFPEKLPIPAVMAYSYSGDENIPSVVMDDQNGAFKIVQYIIEQGHSRIGVIAGDRNSTHTQARLLGYQKALFKNGILYDPELVHMGSWTRENGYRWVDTLLKQKVTAVFCMNDLMAGGVYSRLGELNLKPGEDLAIAGFDNRELAAYYDPPLSTIALPLHSIGYTAGKLIFKLLKGDGLKETDYIREISGKIVVRESVPDIRK